MFLYQERYGQEYEVRAHWKGGVDPRIIRGRDDQVTSTSLLLDKTPKSG